MSLKALHIVFVTAATLLCAGLSYWFLESYSDAKQKTDLVMGVSCAVSAVALVVYGRIVFKKLKNLSYL